MPTSPLVQAFYLVGIAACLFAFWKGGGAERLGAGLIVGVVVLARLATVLSPHSLEPIIRLIGDGLTALGLLAIALRYASLWLGGAMLLYAAQFTLHSYYFVTNRPNDNFHAAVNNATFMGIFVCLALGTAVSWRRRTVRRKAHEAALAAAAAPPLPAADQAQPLA